MKKLVFAFALMVAMVTSATVLANSHEEGCGGHNYNDIASHVTVEGAHCRGTVGCGCPGFAPITNGKVWQQAYCRYCGHGRGLHK